MSWSKGFAEWIDGDNAYLSIAFTWLLDHAFERAIRLRAAGYTVHAGGPALFLVKMRHELADLKDVKLGGDYPEAVTRHNPEATFFSRGCDQGCGFCIVPPMEGRTFTLIPDATPRPYLCDNNLSGLPADYQQHIIDAYLGHGVPLKDANSGFEPHTFTDEVYARWKPLVNKPWRDERGQIERGPWRFAYDELAERDVVLRVMRMLKAEPAKRKRVYVLIGNEPFEACMQRIREVIEHGCEPHVQPEIKLTALEKRPWVKDSLDWQAEAERRGLRVTPRHDSLTEGEMLLRNVARWANSGSGRKCTFDEWDPSRNNSRAIAPDPQPVYDEAQGLFLFPEAA